MPAPAKANHSKVCPRCGAQYENLKSTTCPQCFAILVPVDDTLARQLADARAEVERTPEFQAVKAEDDEQFKQQSFGACLSVAAITVATLILAAVLITLAVRRHAVHSTAPPGAVSVRQTPAPDPLTTLPVAAAPLADVFPPALAPYTRQASDSDVVLTGTLTRLYHAVYAAPDGTKLDVYAVPSGRPTDEQNQFRLGLTLAAQTTGPRPLLFFATEYWRFAALGPPAVPTASAAFRDALAAHFRTR